jgi:hypothetical protein
MSEKPPADVLGALPRSRPHRRSEKRRARPADVESAAAAVQDAATSPAKPAAATPRSAAAKPTPPAAAKARSAAAKAKPAAARAKPSAAKPKAAAARPKPAGAQRKPTTAKPSLGQPAQPSGTPGTSRTKPPHSEGHDIIGTAVQAAAELAEIGISAGARALRRAVSRLPRP